MEGIMPLDKAIFSDKPRVVKYKCIKEMGDTMDDVTWETFTAVAENGTVGALWKAAESCFQQAKLAVDDWHYFIENFDVSIKTLTDQTYKKQVGYVILKTLPKEKSTVTITYKKNVGLMNAIDRINYFYKPTDGMPGNDPAQLMTGINTRA